MYVCSYIYIYTYIHIVEGSPASLVYGVGSLDMIESVLDFQMFLAGGRSYLWASMPAHWPPYTGQGAGDKSSAFGTGWEIDFPPPLSTP